MKKKILLLIFLFYSNFILKSFADYVDTPIVQHHTKHPHSESSFQHKWCSMHNGIEEYENKDKTRVDCLTDCYAVEFDFAHKWAESVGQVEHYALMTGKRGKVVLILECPKKEMVYFKRVERLGKIHNFDVEYVTPQFLNIQNGHCAYSDCKCNKQKNKNIWN